MAINPSAKYANIDTTDPAYPLGKARNVVVKDDGTGTPFDKDWLNDLFGFQQALLAEAGISATGTPDTATASQYLDAIQAIIASGVSGVQSYSDLDALKAAEIDAGKLGVAVRYYPSGDVVQGLVYLCLTPAQYGGTPDGYVDHYDAAGNVLKLVHNGVINVRQAGFVGDGVTDNSTIFTALLASDIKNITGASGDIYYFGTIGLNTQKFTVTSRKYIDWKGADLVVDGDNSGSSTSSAFIKTLDAGLTMVNFTFEDAGFAFAGPSRGVQPIQIVSDSVNTSGYTFGNFLIKKGQSLLTVASNNPSTARASNIRFFGRCEGDEVYYGVNLANNGDDFDGSYAVNKFNRLVFVYGVRGARVRAVGVDGQAASAALYVSSFGNSSPNTEDVDIDATIDTLNGKVYVATQGGAGDGVYKDIDIKLNFKSLGSNLTTASQIVQIGALNSGGAFMSSGTVSIDKLNISISTPIDIENPVSILTASPNYGILGLPNTLLSKTYPGEDQFVFKDGDAFTRRKYGNPSSTTLAIPAQALCGNVKNGLIYARFDIVAANDTTITNVTSTSFYVFAKTDSSGNATVVDASQISTRTIGITGPVFTIGSSGKDITVTPDSAYTSTSGLLFISAKRI